MSYVNSQKRAPESVAKREIDPRIIIAVLSVLALLLAGFALWYFLTPSPVIPNPATVQEPTG